ncbi:uncharacterized protein LOC143300370 isoform X2 [Babylonia areolata]|uniref:uncharacterized protein LOC143300370 isoform X2 n=1 Tax=Babylonia areolata TaxID=304850 RepID=UPI003FD220C9
METFVSILVTVVTALFVHCFVNSGRALGQGADHYCSRDPSDSVLEIRGETEGNIYTLYPGDTHYQNNQNCVWLIDAGPGRRVEITVVSTKLQWAHESAICPGYDHVAIKDGNIGGEETIVLQWCGFKKPLGAVSSGRYMRVEFMSDKNNPYNYAGVHMRFKTFPSGDCAPSWNSSTGGFCYKLLDKEMDWSAAQKECNTGAANLASILSENENTFLEQIFGSSAATAWVGLNDIVYKGQYAWIDGSNYSFSRFGRSHAANQYFRCVVMDFTDSTWKLRDCAKKTGKALCKSNRGSKTVLFPIPQTRPDETDSETPVGRVIAIVVSVLVLVILLIVCFFLYRRRKAQRHKSPSSSSPKLGMAGSRERPAVDLHEVRQEAQQPSAPPEESVMIGPDSRMMAPPAYEEALNHPVLLTPQAPA